MSKKRYWYIFRQFKFVRNFIVGELTRAERLQVMLSDSELAALDEWRFSRHMPSRASAIRELLKRGLAAEGFLTAERGTKSKEFGVVTETVKSRKARSAANERK